MQSGARLIRVLWNGSSGEARADFGVEIAATARNSVALASYVDCCPPISADADLEFGLRCHGFFGPNHGGGCPGFPV